MMQRPYSCCERPAPPPCPPPCPPRICQCDECRRCPPEPGECIHPCAPQRPMPGGLTPRVIAAGREWDRRCALTLEVCGLPDAAEPPLTLMEVYPCGQPTWELLDCADPRAMVLRVKVPLGCLVRDRCNRCHTGRAAITADVRLRTTAPREACWRGGLLVQPCVRLLCIPCPSERPVFDVLLEVLVEAYMVRWEPCLTAPPPRPACPDLPLFPQPCAPPRW